MTSPNIIVPTAPSIDTSWNSAFDMAIKVAPLLLVVFGWFLVNLQNNARETRKERRKAADEAKALVRELYILATVYYTEAKRAISFKIKDQLDELETELLRLPTKPELMLAFNDYHDAITNDPFESAGLTNLPPDHVTIKRISLCKQSLLMRIEESCNTIGWRQRISNWLDVECE